MKYNKLLYIVELFVVNLLFKIMSVVALLFGLEF